MAEQPPGVMNAGFPQEPVTVQAAGRLERVRRRATRVLFVERLWPRVLPAVVLAGLYVLAGLFRLPQGLPDPVHALVLAAVCGGVVWLGWRGVRGVVRPSRAEADRRIERASGLSHRPLAVLTDTPSAVGSPDLWRVWQERVVAALGPLRAGPPHLLRVVSPLWRLSGLLVPALIAGVVLAGDHAPGRLAAAFIPGRDDPDVPFPHVDAWITPPAFTGGAPVLLGSSGHVPSVMEGARLTVMVTEASGRPVLHGSGLSGDETRRMDGSSWRLGAVLASGGPVRLSVRGRDVASWQMTVLPDLRPEIRWGKSPGARKDGWRTDLPYEAHQAYGIEEIVAEIRLKKTPLFGADRVLRVKIPLSGHPKTAKGVWSADLSADPWAGEEVRAVLIARSVSGKTSRSGEVTFRLGERKFRSPVARAVLDLRKRLALGSESREAGADDLAALGETPGPVHANTGIFLNLTAIAAHLGNETVPAEEARSEAVDRLWDLALDIEDRLRGGPESALASIDVRADQEAVQQQLRHMQQDNAHGEKDQAELKERMEALKGAISRKMQALAQQALRDHTAIPDLPGLSRKGDQAFSRLMERMQQDAANGRSGEAGADMQQLEDSIENMRNASPQDLANMARQMAATQQYQEQRAGLRDVIRQQTGLLDHAQSRADRSRRQQATQDEEAGADNDLSSVPTSELLRELGLTPPSGAQGGAQGGGAMPGDQQGAGGSQASGEQGAVSSPSDEERAAREKADRQSDRQAQHALAKATDELGREFHDLSGKDVPGFGKAQTEMKAARKALAEGNDEEAVAAQKRALEALRQGGSQMKQSVGHSHTPPSFFPSFGMKNQGGQGHGRSQGQGQGQRGMAGPGEDGSDGLDDEDDGDEKRAGDQDPLGRPPGGQGEDGAGDGGKLPEATSRERAREIEEELRRRDSDRTRPQEELDYLDRLLKSF
ncbi:DUF4175 domain-containing protein [Acetobacter sp. AN02]|uniref:DUF4175 domain-containing protein n=1 Tax=Acetobacter sp. AN02 TaxID=2894186 RepID=UPI00243441B0|nr:DUF4175 family protein [Acetobacter sp. AN02]MDG6094062.1 DUF4175 domain-containing protein [Acetobacter sp. AN02]